jgi:hypothetical protein
MTMIAYAFLQCRRLLVDLTLVPSSDGSDDFVWVLGPGKVFWVCVNVVEEAVDGIFEFPRRSEYAVLERLVCKLGEEPLDGRATTRLATSGLTAESATASSYPAKGRRPLRHGNGPANAKSPFWPCRWLA